MKKQLFLKNCSFRTGILFCFFFLNSIFLLCGQTGVPCCTAPGVPSGCAEAGTSIANSCIICSLAGLYQGNNAAYGATGSFSCGVPHNSAYISVIADTNGIIDATVITSNCTNDPVEGLQLILYDAAGNEIDCFSVGGALIGTVGASGLTPGGLYTFQVDGFNGDACDFTIIISGAETGALPDPPGPIMMDPDTTLCPGAEVCFEINPVNNTNFFEWIVPANIRITSGGGPNDLFVCGVVETAGGGVVRVTPSNFCFNGVPGILPVVALPIPPSVWAPPLVCSSDMPWDTTINGERYVFDQFGGHEINIVTALGCDSIITFSLIEKVQVSGIIDTTICEGDCVMVGLDCYDDIGSTTIILSDPRFRQQNGCDSTVNLILSVLNPVASITPPDELPCTAGATVLLDGSNSSTGPDFTYEWTATNGGTIDSPINDNVAIVSSPGTYTLSVTQVSTDGSMTCVATETVDVVEAVQNLIDPVFNLALTNVCIGASYSYSIDNVPDAVNYIWLTPPDAVLTGSGTSVMVTFSSLAGGDICVQAIGNCGQSQNICIPITVNPIPTADFTVSSPICLGENSVIRYEGTATPFANFTWNFDGGTPSNVSGPGPHSISWVADGLKTITLTVEENSCVSTEGTQMVQVSTELVPPIINCGFFDNSTITFEWQPVVGASDYTIIINNSGNPITQTDNSFSVNGLNAGDMVTIEVIANSDGTCPSSSSSFTCSTCQSSMTSLQDSICEGETYIFNGEIISSFGTFSDTLLNNLGCDSIIALELRPIITTGTSENVTICEGESYRWNNKQISLTGSYFDTLSSVSGCDSIINLELLVEGADELGFADAGIDQDICFDTINLVGSLFPNVTGEWNALDAGQIQSTNNSSILVDGLGLGQNRFVWTLSSSNCAEYDRDTVQINFNGKSPQLMEDIYEVDSSEIITLDLLSNDDLSGVSNYFFDLNNAPPEFLDWNFDFLSGALEIMPDLEQSNNFMFEYVICNEDCPNICDTTFVDLSVLSQMDRNRFPDGGEYNTVITPNGDGKNDVLCFFGLDETVHPNNIIHIYNRWGNVVHSETPYKNNWNGRRNGKRLPEGTYYYVMRVQLPDIIYYGSVVVRY